MTRIKNRNRIYKVTRILFAIGFFLVLTELAIRYSGLYAQLSEKNGHSFLSLFEPTHHGQFQNYTPNDTLHINNTEFSYLHYIDKYGFRNSNSVDMLDTIDVLALGDSFTEGLGAPQDSSWPVLLSNLYNKRVYNAGIMGSDPVYGLKLLQEQYIRMQPKIVIFAVNYSDLTDIIIRGGEERFLPDGGIKYKKEPWFMNIYRYSHLFRATLHLVFQYDYMFNPPNQREVKLNNALDVLTRTITDANKLCSTHGIKMQVFIHPIPQEYYKNLDSRLDFRKIDELQGLLSINNVDAINLRGQLEDTLKTSEQWKAVSWPIDGHFNSKGYQLMATLIGENLHY